MANHQQVLPENTALSQWNGIVYFISVECYSEQTYLQQQLSHTWRNVLVRHLLCHFLPVDSAVRHLLCHFLPVYSGEPSVYCFHPCQEFWLPVTPLWLFHSPRKIVACLFIYRSMCHSLGFCNFRIPPPGRGLACTRTRVCSAANLCPHINYKPTNHI